MFRVGRSRAGLRSATVPPVHKKRLELNLTRPASTPRTFRETENRGETSEGQVGLGRAEQAIRRAVDDGENLANRSHLGSSFHRHDLCSWVIVLVTR
jgi:hypothetical protein